MSEDWSLAMTALAAFAVDPSGLGGICVRARVGPMLREFQDSLSVLPLVTRRIHPDLSDSQLFGGPDVAATLAAGRLVTERGIAADAATLVLPMAERTAPHLAGRLSQLLDAGRGHALILLDEGSEDAEQAPVSLRDRLAFHIGFDSTVRQDCRSERPSGADVLAARDRLGTVTLTYDHVAALVSLAARFGIDSLRAPILAGRAARALAALSGRTEPDLSDLRIATELVFPSRARQLPAETAERPQDPMSEPADGTKDKGASGFPIDMLVDAVAARLPPSVLADFEARGPVDRGHGSGAGARRRGNRRGRPLAPRRGRPDGRSRIDVIATLRAAAPWQPLRRTAAGPTSRVLIRPDDIHLRRTEDRSDRLVVFCVDASGSAAVARLAEAKGAVELLLVQSYALRDHVALISFRGSEADLLLPPTRSLVQAKRRLAGLPGGGGTPLADGIQMAIEVTAQARRHGLSPVVTLMTDGRANVALDGTGGRAAAMDDARRAARRLCESGVASLVIDTAIRPRPETADLAGALGARRVPLPLADSAAITATVADAFDR